MGKGTGDKSAASEYAAFSKRGFISLEEVDAEETEAILANLGAKKAGGAETSTTAKKDGAAKKGAANKHNHPIAGDAAQADSPATEDPAREGSTVPRENATADKAHPQPASPLAEGWGDLWDPLPRSLQEALDKAQFGKPTPIQEQVLRATLGGGQKKKDILGCAPTGSGKTLAFLLPILTAVIGEKINDRLVALVVAPTRELAIQIKDHLATLTSCSPGIRSAVLVGGLSAEKQDRILGYHPQIVIGTPGRLGETLQSNSWLSGQLPTLNFLVLDEADRLLEAGHFQDLGGILDSIYARRSPNLQTFLFSATLAGQQQLGRRLQFRKGAKPITINVSPQAANPASLQHLRLSCLAEEKTSALLYLLRTSRTGRTLIFVNTIELVKDLAQVLQLLGVPALGLHAQMQQRQRLKSMDRFRSSQQATMVTSDVAARGLDIPSVDTVIHYHVPKSVDVYVHRSGRTARANSRGTSIALCAPHERPLLDRIANAAVIGRHIPDYPEVDLAKLDSLHRPVSLAEKICRLQAQDSRHSRTKTWEQKAAEALGVDLDHGGYAGGRGKRAAIDDDGSESQVRRQRLSQIESLKQQLALCLASDN